jgi:peptide chain release factor subunit 1
MTPITAMRGSLSEALDRLAGIESPEFPVVSLYLDTRPDPQGRDHWDPFVRKALQARLRTYPLRSSARESLERDVEKIRRYLSEDLPAEANGVALFACSALELFEAYPVEAPLEENRLSVSSRPQLYPLARLIDEYPRFAVLVADTRSARILVAGRGSVLDERKVEGRPSRRTDVGGWSQMRFQRHVDQIRQQNVREIVAALERVVREDRVEHVVIAGDEVALPLIRAELSKDMQRLVADTLRLDVHTPDREVLDEAVAALRSRDEQSDAEKVQRALDEYRAGGLAVVGPEAVEAALAAGQVDELLISATLAPPADDISSPGSPGSNNASERPPDGPLTRLTAEFADELVRMARQTSARVTFIENSSLLAGCDGVAAALRYRFTGTGAEKNP